MFAVKMALNLAGKIGIIVAVVVVLLILLLALYIGLKNTEYRINKNGKVYDINLLGQELFRGSTPYKEEDKQWIKLFGFKLKY